MWDDQVFRFAQLQLFWSFKGKIDDQLYGFLVSFQIVFGLWTGNLSNVLQDEAGVEDEDSYVLLHMVTKFTETDQNVM